MECVSNIVCLDHTTAEVLAQQDGSWQRSCDVTTATTSQRSRGEDPAISGLGSRSLLCRVFSATPESWTKANQLDARLYDKPGGLLYIANMNAMSR